MNKNKSIAVLIIIAILSGLCLPIVHAGGLDNSSSNSDFIKIVKLEEINESNQRKVRWKMEYNLNRKQLEETIISIDFKEYIFSSENWSDSFQITSINGVDAESSINVDRIIRKAEKKEKNIYDFLFHETMDSYEILFETVIDKKTQGQDLTIAAVEKNAVLNKSNEPLMEEATTDLSVIQGTTEQEAVSKEMDVKEVPSKEDPMQIDTEESTVTQSEEKGSSSDTEENADETYPTKEIEEETAVEQLEEYIQSRIVALGFSPLAEFNNISYITEENIGTYPFPYKDHNNIRAFDDGHYYVEYGIGTLEKNAVETDADNPDEYEMELIVYGKHLMGKIVLRRVLFGMKSAI